MILRRQYLWIALHSKIISQILTILICLHSRIFVPYSSILCNFMISFILHIIRMWIINSIEMPIYTSEYAIKRAKCTQNIPGQEIGCSLYICTRLTVLLTHIFVELIFLLTIQYLFVVSFTIRYNPRARQVVWSNLGKIFPKFSTSFYHKGCAVRKRTLMLSFIGMHIIRCLLMINFVIKRPFYRFFTI